VAATNSGGIPKSVSSPSSPTTRGREIKKGTLAKILHDLGLTEDDLRNA